MKTVFFFLFLCCISIPSNAQKFNTLSKEEKQKFIERGKQKIKELSNVFGKIPRFPPNSETREILVKTCVKNFTSEATIQIGNKKNGKLIKSKPIPIENYLRNKLKPSRYSIVDVTFISFTVNDFKPVPGELHKYYADYEFVQRWCGSLSEIKTNEGNIQYDYCDDTTKKGRFILEKVNTVLGTNWKLFFDSIYVVDVKLL